MKLSRVEVLESIRMFLKEHITMALICVLFFMVYKDLTNHGLILLILAFAVLYATVMAVCHYGLSKFTQYEKNHTVTPQRLVGYSFLIAMPIYFLWLVFSLIPMIQYELWPDDRASSCHCDRLYVAFNCGPVGRKTSFVLEHSNWHLPESIDRRTTDRNATVLCLMEK